VANGETAIHISGLSTVLGGSTVHRNLDLDVRVGEVVAIIGESGGGKTTLLREMLGLQTPSAGEVRVLGADMRHLTAGDRSTLATRCGVVFQNGALFSALSVFDNVALPVRENGWWPEELIEGLVLLTLQETGIEPRDAMKLPAELSGGMIKRVALARALVLEPDLLFMDEPTTGLAPDQRHAVIQLIATLKHEFELTLVMITHDLDALVGLADRVAVLADQHIVTIGPLAEVAHFPHPFVRSFFLDQTGRCERHRIAAFRSDLKLPQCATEGA